MYELRNIALKIEYDGTEFAGWQRQAMKPSVQALIEDELSRLLDRKIVVYGAGRTDSGVHAKAQIANFWGDSRFSEEQWAKILNFKLPKSIRILKSISLDEKFHAQKKSIGKTYEYYVLNRKFQSALNTRVYFTPRKLDWKKIEEALPYFIGTHDFASFRAAKSNVKTTERTIYNFKVESLGDGLYRFEVSGKGFLKQMVRTMVGTVLEVGEGRWTPEDMAKILNAKNRRAAGRTLPGAGLYLLRVEYPKEYDLF